MATAAAGGWRVWGPGNQGADGATADLLLGQRVYAEYCASCHGANLEGQPDWRTRRPDGRLPAPPHDATGHTWHHSTAQLIELTRKGVAGLVPGYESDMPAFEGVLTDTEIAAVVAYIASTWPQELRRR
ncbi:c-type cytochrome [Falsiroseomonas tokyonensis]|uniref:C-type cytochrome n=1 Tax=Falsiroseomonas tokyonensis TaxID=430521 RepID=A0ABV7C1J3_9PROT|nr:MAG: cytochrome C [Bosea sp. 12-68-7]